MRALEEVVAHFSSESPRVAQELAADALEAARSLAHLADRGRVVPEVGHPRIREIFVHRYRLLYRTTADTVFVLAFIYGARDFARWREERGS